MVGQEGNGSGAGPAAVPEATFPANARGAPLVKASEVMTMISINSAVLLTALALTQPGAPQRAAIPLEGADCSRSQSSFGSDEVAYAVQRASVPMSAGTLDVRPSKNGGVRIQRGAGSVYSITACIAAGAATQAEAQAAAEAVRLQIDGNRVSVSDAPGVRHHNVQLIVEAPAGAQIDAQTTNGPIAIEGVNGSITARATNGPIAINDVTGAVRAVAANGPISVTGSGGNLDVETQNGPISVNLQGSQWNGELHARAQNGPLSLRVADDFRSGVEISSSRRSPWNCRVAACGSAISDEEQGARRVRLGTGPVVVTLSTVNGPVTLDRAR